MPRGTRADPALVGRGLALLDAGLTAEQVANELRVPRRTVSGWSARHRGTQVREERDAQHIESEAIARRTEKAALRFSFLELVTLSAGAVRAALEAGKMSGRDAAWAGAVYFDKVRLLDGEPTAISADAPLADFLRSAGYDRLRVVEGGRKSDTPDGDAGAGERSA